MINKIGLFQKGHTPWNKGKKCPKISEGIKEGYKKGRIVWNKGLTKETDKRIAQPWLGRKRPDRSLAMKGEKNIAKRPEVRERISLKLIRRTNLFSNPV